MAQRLPASDRERLREIAEQFLHAKSFEGAAGFEITPRAQAVIALKACVPIRNLGIEYYRGWSDIIVYPGDFRVQEEYTDDFGVVHREARELCGQSLTQGPMVLSWETIEEERDIDDRDVVTHECAHKLDILNGDANGFPPLHADMPIDRWTATFRAAFDQLQSETACDGGTALDPYAATDPAEFFAVASETFFTLPAVVRHGFPAVYTELATFYRQDPYAILGEPS